jgi:hypothetical protein
LGTKAGEDRPWLKKKARSAAWFLCGVSDFTGLRRARARFRKGVRVRLQKSVLPGAMSARISFRGVFLKVASPAVLDVGLKHRPH